MKLETTTFGLIHPKTLRFARFINTEDECCIFHRLNAESTDVTYRSQAHELRDDASSILECDDLGTILEFLATNEWPHWNDEPDLYDFSAFVPVAIIREKARLAGVGDFIDRNMKVMFVSPKDSSGAEYELSELTVA
jgi:hypothetical protein